MSVDYHVSGCAHDSDSKSNSPIMVGSINELHHREIEKLCGVGGLGPASYTLGDLSKLVSFQSLNDVARVSYRRFLPRQEKTSSMSTYFENLRSIILNIMRAISIAQEQKLCCNSYTYFVKEHMAPETAPARLTLNTMTLKVIKEFLVELEVFQQGFIRDAMSSSERFVDFCLQIFSGLSPFNKALESLKHFSPIGTGLHLCGLAVQFISLSFLSYSQAHIGVLHPCVVAKGMDYVQLSGTASFQSTSPGLEVYLQSYKLSCLDSMVMDAVLAFSFTRTRDNILQSPHDVKATAESLLDTWGPGGLVYSRRPHKLLAVKLRNGYIHCKADAGNMCHFSPADEILSLDYGKSLDPYNMIIGAPISINERCAINARDCWTRSAAALEPLGSQSTYWAESEQQIGLQLGQYIVMQVHGTRSKIRGRTLKEAILQGPDEILMDMLNDFWGLQVSFCTTVCRRVQIKDLVADLAPAFINSAILDQALWQKISLTKMTESLQNDDDFRSWIISLDTTLQSCILHLIRRILESLKSTGIEDSNKYLVVAWPQVGRLGRCFKIKCANKSGWARVLKDSEDCATFAYITTRRMENSVHNCRGPVPYWQHSTNMLETAVILRLKVPTNLPSLEHNKKCFFRKMDDLIIVKVVRQHGNVYLETSTSAIPKPILQRLFARDWTVNSRIRERQAEYDPAEQVMVHAA